MGEDGFSARIFRARRRLDLKMTENPPTLDLKTLPEELAIQAVQEMFGWQHDDAAFYYAIATGQLKGDTQVVSDNE
jgi:hypothetical protein